MNRTPPGGPSSAAAPAIAAREVASDPLDPAQSRAVHRAVAELRRGTPVLLSGAAPIVMLAAETGEARGLAEFSRLAGDTPLLLLAPTRAAAILHRPVQQSGPAVALRVSERLLAAGALQGLADPTLDQTRPEIPEQAPTPELAAAALALVKLARLLPAALSAQLTADATEAAAQLGLLSVPAGDVLAYRGSAELRRVAEAEVPLVDAARTRIIAFRTVGSGIEHLAIVVGEPGSVEAPLVRLHSECFTGDLLGSLRCDCGLQLRGAIRRMAQEHAGVLLYLGQEGRGIGLVSKLRAYELQDRGLDTLDANRALGWDADERSFLIAATMLEALSIRRIRLLTNNPDKMRALVACGVDVAGRVPHAFAPNGVNDRYLATKARRFGHWLE
jgi:GTP cyclohydrolase II